ncbi:MULTISPECIES: arylsulfotransferase family protein [Halorussus]|uniref:arylsulfotransferase family protein n=1 Tax=Halorussus TaxID=1070314 RepID=UPI00209E6C0F|nr:arylsulfotransferase family protein [Halorussus vallis]USZ76678.1 arylsulfotransferase family protein [Halorussus vallis]
MRRYRAVFAVLLLVCSASLAYSYVSSPASAAVSKYERQATLAPGERAEIVPPREGITVVAGHGMHGESASLVAFNPNGTVRYHNDTFHGYFDVDPVKGTRTTVEYVAERAYEGSSCDGKCTLSVVERVNLTTGELLRVYERVIPADRGANWHDVDRVGEDRLLVGDIRKDEVYVVNTTTGLTEWEWEAQTEFPISGGGPYPADWAHLNDVERLPDGRYMVSLRNQDQVVFLNRSTGMQSNWTLGADDDYSVLYEQHNPDYIPKSEGGPAVVVADSLNHRLVEYQRVNGSWERTWTWADDEMRWPRDADRLPNGNTLVADTNANRVLEVDRQGDVVWSVDFYSPYEVERLGTGDESAGGPSAKQAGLESRGGDGASETTTVVAGVKPLKLLNGLSYMLPVWMGLRDAAVVGVMALSALAWAAFEVWALLPAVTLRWPFRFSR